MGENKETRKPTYTSLLGRPFDECNVRPRLTLRKDATVLLPCRESMRSRISCTMPSVPGVWSDIPPTSLAHSPPWCLSRLVQEIFRLIFPI